MTPLTSADLQRCSDALNQAGRRAAYGRMLDRFLEIHDVEADDKWARGGR